VEQPEGPASPKLGGVGGVVGGSNSSSNSNSSSDSSSRAANPAFDESQLKGKPALVAHQRRPRADERDAKVSTSHAARPTSSIAQTRPAATALRAG
jgi:hypothetical protein